MGNQCSSHGRSKIEEGNESDLKKEKENVPFFKRKLSLQEVEGITVMKTAKEKTLSREAAEASSEQNSCGEKSSALKHECISAQVSSQSLSLSEDSDPALYRDTEEKEAKWVGDNRAELIQSVTSVMPIADKMLQQQVIHKEMYSKIKNTLTSEDQMRHLYEAITCTKAKSAFFRILQEIQPATCQTEDDIKEAIKKNKEFLRNKCIWEFEIDYKDEKQLDKIYTELHIIQGESDCVNTQHEIWEMRNKAKNQTDESAKINCNDIFKKMPEDIALSGRDKREVRAIRTVMTKGIAGIGKTVSVKKFILDWADGRANQDLDFIFMFPFRELNLVFDDLFSLETLVKEFHPQLKNIAVAKIFANHKVLFIFDGLDESKLQLDFKNTNRLSNAEKESSVDTLVTNLIREHLLPSALVWITSRPGAVQRIPREYVYQWTEVRGFDDPQKILYFRKRVEDKAVAERIISHITTSRSLHIMCHIPIFCWIAAKVLAYLMLKLGSSQDENIKIPSTLTEMYTHFLLFQMRVTTKKYEDQDDSDTAEIFKSNEEFILKLGRMAFEQLEKGNIIFTSDDLKKYGIDKGKVGVHCGLCTAILKGESVFNTKKLYCFVHLTVQEYFAALYVYHSFASKRIDSQSLKDYLLKGSQEELESILNADPVDLPLNELMEIAMANSTLRKTGELDMFLRFLVGMSLQSTQKLLQGLIWQTEEHSGVVEKIRTSLIELDLLDCSPERCLNLIHCLIELKDSSLHDSVRQYLKPNHGPEKQLSPVQCSALADSILMSNTPLDEFNMKKYRPSAKGIFRLVPAVRNSRSVRISGVDLETWHCETISSALQMPDSVLTELHLTNCAITDTSIEILSDGLLNSKCKLEALSLFVYGHTYTACEKLTPAIISVISNLRELELSGNLLGGLLQHVLSVGLSGPKLKKLRLNRNLNTTEICEELVTALKSTSGYLRELELSSTNLKDSEMEILSTGLMSTNCTLEVLSLSHNRLTEKGCEMLTSALTSGPSSLKELDLSYNDLQDSGVMALCNALRSPHCGLKRLRLSLCKVTGDGCSSLASALRSDRCSLGELDLSFNHLTDQGVKLLTEIQKDSRCSLQYLNVDHNEECWVNLKLLRQYACDLTLDPNTAGRTVLLTKNNKMAEFVREKQPYPDHLERFDVCQVMCEEGLTGRHYWEVEGFSADIGVAYKSIDRAGDCSSDFSLRGNENSWCWSLYGDFYHNGSCLGFQDSYTYRGVTGVYLDWPAGILSFFKVFPDTVTHLYTVRTTFIEPLHPAFSLHDGSVYLCEIN
ncbi:NLR family CARD domain-containing protein 3-like [Brachyistius frenatus]|uniref:NLR family CARD domain-containing protein 3-like n=1 Tax=Brachyistius frenatus TaxID=100188 RepID=UPI0037E72DDA